MLGWGSARSRISLEISSEFSRKPKLNSEADSIVTLSVLFNLDGPGVSVSVWLGSARAVRLVPGTEVLQASLGEELFSTSLSLKCNIGWIR